MRPPNPREVREGVTATFRFRPDARWTSASGLVKAPSGQTIQTPTPTIDTTSTVVASYASASESIIKLASVASVARGVVYIVTSSQWGDALVEVSSVDPATALVTLVEPLPGIPDAGDAFRGSEVWMSVAAITERALGYRAIVRGGGEGQEETARFDVVYQPLSEIITARDVRRHVATAWPNHPFLRDEERLADIALRASDRVRARLREADRYPDRYFDASDLSESSDMAMLLVLAESGLVPGNVDPTEYRRGLVFDLRDAIGGVIQSNIPYDANADDALDEDEAAGIWSGRLYR